jgi:hypothetical protein
MWKLRWIWLLLAIILSVITTGTHILLICIVLLRVINTCIYSKIPKLDKSYSNLLRKK